MSALGTGLVTVGVSRMLLVAAALGLATVGVQTARTDAGPVGGPFLALLGLLAATALCLGVTAGAGTANKVIWLGTNLAIPVAALAVSCRYYGISLFRSRPRTAGVVAPLLAGGIGSLLVILGTARQSPGTAPPLDVLAGFSPRVYEAASILGRMGRYYAFLLVAAAVGIVVVNVLRYDHLDVRLAAAFAFVGSWPWVGNFVVPEVTAAFGAATSFGVLAGGYVSSLVVAGLIVGPLGLFASSPAAGNIGPERVLDSMADPVVITDDGGQILRVNAATCETFGTTPADAVGNPLPSLLGRQFPEVDETGPVSLDTAAGTREFSVTRSGVTDGAVERGQVFVLRDVTRRQSRQQRLEVLNRVLRHNLRNDATSIIGRAQLIEEGAGGEESAQEIVETTRELVGVAESARDIESMMAAPAAAEPVDLAVVVERVVSDIEAEHPNVDLTTAVPETTNVSASERVLETVLRELLENAANHNDAEEPYVVVSAEPEDGSVTLAVSDNGPGVPEHERAVLDAEGEDQLQHGSGLGLWAVQWGVTKLGGDLTISDNAPRGTTVTVTVPGPAASSAEMDLRAAEQAES